MDMEKQPFSQCGWISYIVPQIYGEYLFAQESSQGQFMVPETKRYCSLKCMECAFLRRAAPKSL